MQTNQLFPDVSYQRRPKIKPFIKLNLVEMFPNISRDKLANTTLNKTLQQIFPDISAQLRSKQEQKKITSTFIETSSLLGNKSFQWLMLILTLSATIYLYFNTFTLDL